MYAPTGVKTSADHPIPDTMKAWVLGDPDQLKLVDKLVPVPRKAEVLVRIDAVAICATDLEIIHHGPPAMIQGDLPFNKNFTPGHEYMGTLVAIPDSMSDEEATLVVTAGTAMYGLTELGGLVAGEGVVVLGPGPIGLLGVAVAKALGASPVILTGTRDNRLQIGRELGADHVINVRRENAVEAVRRLTGGKGIDYVIECSGAADAVSEAAQRCGAEGCGRIRRRPGWRQVTAMIPTIPAVMNAPHVAGAMIGDKPIAYRENRHAAPDQAGGGARPPVPFGFVPCGLRGPGRSPAISGWPADRDDRDVRRRQRRRRDGAPSR